VPRRDPPRRGFFAPAGTGLEGLLGGSNASRVRRPFPYLQTTPEQDEQQAAHRRDISRQTSRLLPAPPQFPRTPEEQQELALDLTPGIGDAKAVVDGTRAIKDGHPGLGLFLYGTAALGALPFAGSAVDAMRYYGRGVARRAATAGRVGRAAAPAADGAQSAGAARPSLFGPAPGQSVPMDAAATDIHNATRPYTGSDFGLVSAGDFHSAISRAQHAPKGGGTAGDMLHIYEPGEYEGMRNYLSADGRTGFAIKPDGDLVSVFNTGRRGAGGAAVQHALDEGATMLDAFDGYLPDFYKKHGFEEYMREANWTEGGPDVVYMRQPRVQSAVMVNEAGEVVGRGPNHGLALIEAGHEPGSWPPNLRSMFETNTGRVIDRDEAARLATARGQTRDNARVGERLHSDQMRPGQLNAADNTGGGLLRQGSPIRMNKYAARDGTSYVYELPDGRSMEVTVARDQNAPGVLKVEWIGSRASDLGQGSPRPGVSGVREILRDIAGDYPDATSFVGSRVGGASRQAGGAGFLGRRGEISIDQLGGSGAHPEVGGGPRLNTADNTGGGLLRQGSPIRLADRQHSASWGHDTFHFDTPQGRVEVIAQQKPDGVLSIDWVGKPNGDPFAGSDRLSIGHAGMRQILSEVQAAFPEARTISYNRISGARVHGRPHDEVVESILGNTQTQKPMRRGFLFEDDSPLPYLAQGASGGGLLRGGNFFDRAAPKIAGTHPTAPELVIPQPRTDRTTLSPLVEAIQKDPASMQQHVAGRAANARANPEYTEPWYELGGMKQAFDQLGEGTDLNFRDFNILGAAASANNSVPMENAIVGIANYMRTHPGATVQDALRAFSQTTGYNKGLAIIPDTRGTRPGGTPGHIERGLESLPRGLLSPTDPFGANWKTPFYYDGRMGGSAGVPLDAHERMDLMLGVMADPRLRNIATRRPRRTPAQMERGARLSTPHEAALKLADKLEGQIPLKNAQDYKSIMESVYEPVARQQGLLGNELQAQRWIGGADVTKIDTPVGPSFQQIFEDQMRRTLLHRGEQPTFSNMERLMRQFLRGEDFIIP
jgi:hypothetical protein